MNKKRTRSVNLYVIDSDATFQNKIINTFKNNSACDIHLYNSTKDFYYTLNSNNKSNQFDLHIVLITSDISDQDETFKTIRQIKKINKNAEIILLTEKENMEYISEAFNNGVYEIIKKNDNALYRIDNSINGIKSMKQFKKKKQSLKLVVWLFGFITVVMIILYFSLR